MSASIPLPIDTSITGHRLIHTYEVDDAEALRAGLLRPQDLPAKATRSCRTSRFGERFWKASRLGNGKVRIRLEVESNVIQFPLLRKAPRAPVIIQFPQIITMGVCHV